MTLKPFLLRLVWMIIEDMPSHDLLALSDTALAAMILREVSRRVLLTGEEICAVYTYVGSRLLLIRDIADYRCSASLSLVENPIPVTPISLLHESRRTGTL